MMDEFLKDIMTSIFKKWVTFQKIPNCDIQETENIVSFSNEHGVASITFNPQNIIELQIVDNRTQNVQFYLHFQMKTIKHANELFSELIEGFLSLTDKDDLDILLCCSGGLTTGFFAQELNQKAKELNLEYSFSATPYMRLFDYGKDYDIILLAPQISYMAPKVKEFFPAKVVISIPPILFGKYDSAGCIDLIKNHIKSEKTNKAEERVDTPSSKVRFDKKILTISIYGHRVYYYRIYQDNKILVDQTLIKNKISLTDIEDIIDVALVSHPDIAVIGISTPGIINNGILDLKSEGIDNFPLQQHLENKYHIKSLIINNANCAAMGFYESTSLFNSCSLYIQTRPRSYGGIGTVFRGRLVRGKNGIAGECQFLPQYKKIDVLNTTNEECLSYMARSIASTVAIINPDVIAYYSPLIFEEGDLIALLKQYLPDEYIPQLIRLNNIKEYTQLGIKMTCIQQFKKAKHFV